MKFHSSKKGSRIRYFSIAHMFLSVLFPLKKCLLLIALLPLPTSLVFHLDFHLEGTFARKRVETAQPMPIQVFTS